jgi:hypothetical protein
MQSRRYISAKVDPAIISDDWVKVRLGCTRIKLYEYYSPSKELQYIHIQR